MDGKKRTNSEKIAVCPENVSILKYGATTEQIKQAVAKVNEYRKSALSIKSTNINTMFRD